MKKTRKISYDETCIICGAFNAYSWDDVNETLGVYHIGASSCWEWECGKCRAHHVNVDSPLNSPCYTHSED